MSETARLIEPREPVVVTPLSPGEEREIRDWAAAYLLDHPYWEMAGIGNNNQAWARDVLRLAGALDAARDVARSVAVPIERHPFTCGECRPSPEWTSHAEYAAHVAREHGSIVVGFDGARG